MADKKREQGEVGEPQELAAEDVVGAEEEPTERQREREQALVEEPVAESEQRIAEATAPASAESRAALGPHDVDAEGDAPTGDDDLEEELGDEGPRQKPEIPGADLEVDIVREGEDALERDYEDDGADELAGAEGEAEDLTQPIADAAISLSAEARYRATGKRKTAVARVTLRPGSGAYTINGRDLPQHFPRGALQRTIRQPLEAVGYDTRIDVVASLHGGGMAAQAGALRHGISRALIEAAPNLRAELKRRGFLTRDPRVKERKKAGLKKARKRPQFSKR